MTHSHEKAAASARPLTDTEYWALSDKLEAEYIHRPSDDRVAEALKLYLSKRRRWAANRGNSSPRKGEETAEAHSNNTVGELEERAAWNQQAKYVKFELRGIIVSGRSGAGKSRMVAKTLALNGLFGEPDGLSMPLLELQLDGPRNLHALGRDILRKLDYPVVTKLGRDEVWDLVRTHLALAQVEVVYLDEIQHVSKTANVLEATNILDTLKSLCTSREHPVVVILSGTPDFSLFAQRDDQVHRRFDFVPLESLEIDDAPTVADTLMALAKHASMSLEQGFEEHLLPRLIHAGAHQIGRTMELAVAAALRATRPIDEAGNPMPPDAVLTTKHFAAEYEKRSGNASFANVFLADNWHLLDVSAKNIVSLSQLPNAQLALDDTPFPKPRKKRKGSA